MNANRSERGQVLVLIILVLVVLFGFAALAVDMGQLMSARRNAQSAADAAAMAAAWEAVGGSKDQAKALAKGFELAAVNGYDNNTVDNWVVVNNPPIGGPYCGVCGTPTAKEYYQVKIKVRLNPIFAQIFYKGVEQTEVEAIAHAKTYDSISAGDTILSLSKDDDSMNFSGTVSVEVDGGNIRSNGGMVKNGTSGSVIVVSPGKIYHAGDFSGSTSPLSPKPVPGNSVQMVGGWQEPYCPTAEETATWTAGSGYKTKKINDVNYYYYPDGLSVENLPAGIHCIENGIGKGNFVGKNVLIILLSGGIDQTGNDSVDFRADTDLKDKNGNQWGGMVFYAPPSNTSKMKFGGNSGAYFYGTVYAPGGQCDIGGTEDGSADHAAFICYTVKFHGTPVTKIKYDPAELFHFPPMVELVQ